MALMEMGRTPAVAFGDPPKQVIDIDVDVLPTPSNELGIGFINAVLIDCYLQIFLLHSPYRETVYTAVETSFRIYPSGQNQ